MLLILFRIRLEEQLNKQLWDIFHIHILGLMLMGMCPFSYFREEDTGGWSDYSALATIRGATDCKLFKFYNNPMRWEVLFPSFYNIKEQL